MLRPTRRSLGVAALPLQRVAIQPADREHPLVRRVPGDLSTFLAKVEALGQKQPTYRLLTDLPGASSSRTTPLTKPADAQHVQARKTQASTPAPPLPQDAGVDNLRCAPPGLVAALGEALGLHGSSATPEAVAFAARDIDQWAQWRAEEVVLHGIDRAVGPGRLLPADWLLASREELAAQLARMFAAYIRELVDIIGVSTTFNQMTLPVALWRRRWADDVVSERNVRELWGTAQVLAHERSLWSQLGIGFSLLDGAVSNELAMQAREELELLAASGGLTDFSASTCNPGSRHLWLRFGSEDGPAVPPALRQLSDQLAGLPGALEAAALELEAREPGSLDVPRLRLFPAAMAASYGPGSYYVPHLDMYSSGSHGFMNSRLLTIICYLNPDWEHGTGGELRLFAQQEGDTAAARSDTAGGAQIPSLLGISADHSESTAATAHDPDRYVDVAPLLGRIVMFRSRDVWHGIQELTYARWAVTVWLLADTT